MIAGAMLNELHNINPTTKTYILIVRKDSDTSAHCSSLRGIDEVGTTRFIVVDDFIASGETIEAVIQALDEQLGIFPHPTNKFLSDIGYAKDPNYISKLKVIVNRNDKRRSE